MQQNIRTEIDSYVASLEKSELQKTVIVPPSIDSSHSLIFAMSPFIIKFIADYPLHAQKFKHIHDVVAVVSGGKALEHYIDIPKENFTKDFDLRVCHLSNVTSPLYLREAIYLFRSLLIHFCPIFSLSIEGSKTPQTFSIVE